MAIFTWPLVIYGVLGGMVDPYPMPSEDEMRLTGLFLSISIASALACLSLSSWIGGLVYHQAKKRSLAIGFLNAAFLISILGFFSLDFFGL